ncbi:MAG: hypothetical protein ACLR1I_00085 [Ruminococcus sp.]
MYTYKRTITSGDMIEVEFYQSIRKIGKNYGGRKSNNSLSSAKMRKANKLRAVKHMQRLINANFGSGDFFCRFSAPYGTYETEEEFRKEVGKWLDRINYRRKKQGKGRLKYIAFIECGKSGKIGTYTLSSAKRTGNCCLNNGPLKTVRTLLRYIRTRISKS